MKWDIWSEVTARLVKIILMDMLWIFIGLVIAEYCILFLLGKVA